MWRHYVTVHGLPQRNVSHAGVARSLLEPVRVVSLSHTVGCAQTHHQKELSLRQTLSSYMHCDASSIWDSIRTPWNHTPNHLRQIDLIMHHCMIQQCCVQGTEFNHLTPRSSSPPGTMRTVENFDQYYRKPTEECAAKGAPSEYKSKYILLGTDQY